MEESILTSVKKSLGISEEYEHFDSDIIMHINGVLMTLTQIGLGPENGFLISDKTTTWKDFVDAGEYDPIVTNESLGSIMSYVSIKVKLIFDPPSNSFTIEAMKKTANELEWRLNLAAERKSNAEV